MIFRIFLQPFKNVLVTGITLRRENIFHFNIILNFSVIFYVHLKEFEKFY